MGSLARDHGDPALLAFVGQLIEDGSLETAAEAVARKLLDQGVSVLNKDERATLDREVIDPYLGACEACKVEPTWAEVLHVFDTGLCAGCLEKLEGVDIPDVRPDWMPLRPPPVVDEDLPAETDEEPVATDALVAAPLGA